MGGLKEEEVALSYAIFSYHFSQGSLPLRRRALPVYSTGCPIDCPEKSCYTRARGRFAS